MRSNLMARRPACGSRGLSGVLLLNVRRRMLGEREDGHGLSIQSGASARGLFRSALLPCRAVCLVHNNRAAIRTPTEADIKVDTGPDSGRDNCLESRVLDPVIIAGRRRNGLYGFVSAGVSWVIFYS